MKQNNINVKSFSNEKMKQIHLYVPKDMVDKVFLG